MSLGQLLSKIRNANSEADQRSMENDSSLTYPSNVTTAPTHSLSGRDSVTLLDETRFSLTDTVGVAGISEVATPDYSTGTWQAPVW